MILVQSIFFFNYCLLVPLILLGFFYASLDVAGIVIAGVLMVATIAMTDTNYFRLTLIRRAALFLALAISLYFIIGLWMGAHNPVTGLGTRAWWVQGEYTEFGRSLVWKWVGWGMAVYVFAETLRKSPRLF